MAEKHMLRGVPKPKRMPSAAQCQLSPGPILDNGIANRVGMAERMEGSPIASCSPILRGRTDRSLAAAKITHELAAMVHHL